MHTIIESATFQAAAEAIWSREDHEDFVIFLAQNPRAGAVIPGSGGVRKIRWGASGRGKRGGVRVVYFCSSDSELWLLALYHKGQRETIPAHELKHIKEIVCGEKYV